MFLFLQELPKQEGFSDWSKIIAEGLFLVGSNIITYLVVRRKNESDIFKNIAEGHKSEADTTETNARTISTLAKDLDIAIEKARTLRRDVGSLEEEVETLIETILEKVKPLLKAMELLVDQIVLDSASSEIRRKAVVLLEKMYALKEFISKKQKGES